MPPIDKTKHYVPEDYLPAPITLDTSKKLLWHPNPSESIQVSGSVPNTNTLAKYAISRTAVHCS